MKLAIMQPYLFPYLGYFQLVAAADRFVFFDDVNYINRGWINRNRVLLGDEVHYMTVPLSGASQTRKINEIDIQPRDLWLRKLLESIRHAYAKAPHYARVSQLLGDVLGSTATSTVTSIGTLASRSVVDVARYLKLDTDFVMSSAPYGNAALKGEQRLLDICAKERADCYVNLPGGKDLYAPDTFASAGVELRFIEPALPPYPQHGKTFHPGLSILDVLMFNDPDEARAMLATG
jgi:hypothetical protein